MECHLPYVITQCYLTPDTGEHATHNHRLYCTYSFFVYQPASLSKLLQVRLVSTKLNGAELF